MKYKIGQRVRTLPNAKQSGIDLSDCGREAIIDDDKHQTCLHIKMVSPTYWKGWWVNSEYIELSVQKGEQLLFEFMEEG